MGYVQLCLWVVANVWVGADVCGGDDADAFAIGERARSRKMPLVLHVGPSLLIDSELVFYESMRTAGPFRAVFVEPNPAVLERLERRIRTAGGEESTVDILAMAMCRADDESVPFFRFSPGFRTDFPHAESVMDMLQEWGTLEGAQHLLQDVSVKTSFHWQRWQGIGEPRWDDYVQEIRTACVTPARLLDTLAASPRDVDLAIVDAEGVDAEVVDMLTALDGFRPAVLQFEWGHVNNNSTGRQANRVERTLRVLRRLARWNYTLFRMGVDIVALAPPGT
eukprot:CAMPEP_0171133262 /NCGR_PEP_ID=MMETSP0766_2-20121228/125964_1 /TAXON_ID=439317 /ORGANISM="Gambierdiscus australes, Strain CAWD 149" /LENGTH=278 /DNA_ID=CAMNT_0011596633 /DNA_START=203 /DNA_END=1040 /DNA_ORIENTATION=+